MNNNSISYDPESKKFQAEEREVAMVNPEQDDEVEELEPGEKPPEESYGQQIRDLLAEGYTGKQIIELGYAKSTTIQEARRFVKANGGTIMHGKGGNGNGSPMLPVKLGKGDSIPIESELANIRLQDGEYKLGFVDGMRVLVLGAKLNQMLIAGLSETTSSQLALLKEAKSDSKEVAQETVLEVLPHFAEMLKEAARASSPNPMASMMSRLLEGPMTQAFSGMFSMFGKPPGQGQPGQALPEGWSDSSKEK